MTPSLSIEQYKMIMASEFLLEVKHVQAAYGDSQVLFDISLSVRKGEVATLLGRNGMGKTTTVKTLMGVVRAKAGGVRFRGEDITSSRPDQIARKGIAVVPEGRNIFPNLTVRENLVAYAANRNGRTEPWTLERVYDFFPRLSERSSNMGNQLSGGEQQMLAICRALMTNPELLIMDEVTEGLAPLIREEIWRCLEILRREGQTILVIDKYVDRLLRIADHHTIINRGAVAWQGSTIELKQRPELWQKYVGV